MAASAVSDLVHLWTPPQEGSKLTHTCKLLALLQHQRGRARARRHLDRTLRSCSSHRFHLSQLATASIRGVPSCGMDRSSSQQHSRLLLVIWSCSVNETQISTKRKFVADDFCPLRVERVSVRRLTEDADKRVVVRAKPIPQRSSSASREDARYCLRRAGSRSSRLCRSVLCSQSTACSFCGEDRELCQSRDGAGVIFAVQTSVSLVDAFAAMSSVST